MVWSKAITTQEVSGILIGLVLEVGNGLSCGAKLNGVCHTKKYSEGVYFFMVVQLKRPHLL